MAEQQITESIDDKGFLHLSNILDNNTGQYITYTETTEINSDSQADGVVFRKYNGRYIKRDISEVNIDIFGSIDGTNDSAILQKAINATSTLRSKKLVIDKWELVLKSAVTSAVSGITIEFRNGAKLSAPVPSSNTAWAEQKVILNMSGNDLTFINLYVDGKFNNVGLNSVPNPVGKFVQISGDRVSFLGKTIANNSGGYNLDLSGDENYMEDVYIENNAYSGLRWTPSKDSKFFRIKKIEARQNVGPIGRKSGLTVNGQKFVDLIEVGTYIGYNAPFFTEATVTEIGSKYYKNVNIGYYRNFWDQDVQTSQGAPGSSFSGKMENVENLKIGKIDNTNNSPLKVGQGVWLSQCKNIHIDEIYTNAGGWIFGQNTYIGRLTYKHTGNTGSTITDVDDLNNSYLEIGEFVVDMDSSVTPNPYTGLFKNRSDSTHKLGSYKSLSGGNINLAQFTNYNIRGQILVGKSDTIPNTITSSAQQGISYDMKITFMPNATNLTRDVVRGEYFSFTNESSMYGWLCTFPGTCVWTAGAFTGTARFQKFLSNKTYTTTSVAVLSALLTTNDVGYVTEIDGVPKYWNGSSWLVIGRVRYTAKGASSSITPGSVNEFFECNTVSAQIQTLLADANTSIGTIKEFRNNGNLSLTITPDTGVTIDGGSTSIVLNGKNDYIKIIASGVNIWRIVNIKTKALASANTATVAAGATPTKAEFDSLLTELRDLKTKMQTAGLLT